MEQPKTYKDTEVLEYTVRRLQDINVPVGLKAQITDPIDECVRNLIAVLNAIKQKEMEEIAASQNMDGAGEENITPLFDDTDGAPES